MLGAFNGGFAQHPLLKIRIVAAGIGRLLNRRYQQGMQPGFLLFDLPGHCTVIRFPNARPPPNHEGGDEESDQQKRQREQASPAGEKIQSDESEAGHSRHSPSCGKSSPEVKAAMPAGHRSQLGFKEGLDHSLTPASRVAVRLSRPASQLSAIITMSALIINQRHSFCRLSSSAA